MVAPVSKLRSIAARGVTLLKPKNGSLLPETSDVRIYSEILIFQILTIPVLELILILKNEFLNIVTWGKCVFPTGNTVESNCTGWSKKYFSFRL